MRCATPLTVTTLVSYLNSYLSRRSIGPHLKPGTMILTMPAPGNFDMLARQVLGPKVTHHWLYTLTHVHMCDRHTPVTGMGAHRQALSACSCIEPHGICSSITDVSTDCASGTQSQIYSPSCSDRQPLDRIHTTMILSPSMMGRHLNLRRLVYHLTQQCCSHLLRVCQMHTG
jgi:hypothetical protein